MPCAKVVTLARLDTHFPREDKRKVSVMLKIVKEWKPTHISLLGDLDDMEAPSRWAAGLKAEVEGRLSKTTPTVNKFLDELRIISPKSEMDWFYGNHEDRYNQYVAKNAKALDGMWTLDDIYKTKDRGIATYQYASAPVRKFGKFHIHHGTAVGTYPGDSARKELDKWGVSGFSGHTHRLGSSSKTTLEGSLEWYECGHLSDLKKQDYVTLPNWQHGFYYAYVDGVNVYPFEGRFRGNKVIVDGKLFQ